MVCILCHVQPLKSLGDFSQWSTKDWTEISLSALNQKVSQPLLRNFVCACWGMTSVLHRQFTILR